MEQQPHSLYGVNSYYAYSANKKKIASSLVGSHNTDVVVVGGGLVGLSAALELAEKNYRVALIDAKPIGWAASGRSGGQVILDYACGIEYISNHFGKAIAKQFFDFSVESIDILRKRIKKYAIQCDFVEGQATLAEKKRQDKDLERFHEMYQSFGYQTELWDMQKTRSIVDSPLYSSGLFDKNGGHLHPLNYTLGLAAACEKLGVVIYENTPLLSFSHDNNRVQIHSYKGTIHAKFSILAMGAYLPFSNKKLMVVLKKLCQKMLPVETYIAATQPLGKQRALSLVKNNMAICDSNFVLDYYRFSADWRLLFGGKASYFNSILSPTRIGRLLYSRMIRVFPQLENVDMQFAWGGMVDITLNRAPHFGRIAPNVLFVQGLSGHGVAFSNIAGKIVAEAIHHTANRFDFFSQVKHTSFPGGALLRAPLLAISMLYFRIRDYF